MMPPEPPEKRTRLVRLPKELRKLDRSMAHLLHRAQQLARDIFRQEMGSVGLTRPQFSFLLSIFLHPGIGQKELAASTGTDSSTIANMAARMEACGYIVRERRPGSPRGVNLDLTPAGKRRLKRAQLAAARADRTLLHFFPPEHHRSILSGLMRLSDEMENREKQRRQSGETKPRKAGSRSGK